MLRTLTAYTRRVSQTTTSCRPMSTTKGLDYIRMPSIMNNKEGTVSNWSKKVGETFFEGDRLCEITLPMATIGIDAKCNGILAKIMVDRYETAPADSHIAVYALSQENYMSYLAESMQEAEDAAKMADTNEVEEEKHRKPDAAVLMKVVRHLVQTGSIDGASVFGKKLQSLARKGDPELLTTLESCCEGGSYNQETFDEAYFLQNARDIIQEDDEEEEEGKMEKHQQQLSKH